MSRPITEDTIVQFLVHLYPGPLDPLDPVFPTEEDAREAWRGWLMHMEIEPSSTIYPVRDPNETLELAKTRASANKLATTLVAKRKEFSVMPVNDDGSPAWEFTIAEENHPSRYEL
jgi:hypothetical protein